MIKVSRSKYSHPVKDVEDEINRWASNMDVPNAQAPSDISNPQSFPKAMYKPTAPRPSDSAKLYDAICSNCGKKTKVVFEPTKDRPVYCKSCLKKMKAGSITAGAQPKLTVPVRETVSVPAQAVRVVQVKNKPKGNNALGDLGIEFGPASPSQGGPASPPASPNPIRREASRAESQGGPSPSPRKELPPPAKIPPAVRPRIPDFPTAKIFSLDELMHKGENVPFNKGRKDKKEKKSVDVEGLRKTLEQALQKTEEPARNVPPASNASRSDADRHSDAGGDSEPKP